MAAASIEEVPAATPLIASEADSVSL